jgi:protein FAM32A
MSAAKSAVVIGGKFRFKGESTPPGVAKKKAKGALAKGTLVDTSATLVAVAAKEEGYAVSSKFKADVASEAVGEEGEDYLTDAQRRHRQKQRAAEAKEVAAAVAVPYRERIQKFNYKLSTTTEHNDIPRVSAAGNG